MGHYVALFDVDTGESVEPGSNQTAAIVSISVSPVSRLLATSSTNGPLTTWKYPQRRPQRTWAGHEPAPGGGDREENQ